MIGEETSDSGKNDFSKSLKYIFGPFENIVLFIFKVEWLTPVGRMNFVCAIGVIIIFIILALRGMVQNTALGFLFAFIFLFIMSVAMSSRSCVANEQDKLKKL